MEAELRRSTWTIADQIASSLSNFMVGVVVARSVSPAEFGQFAVAFGVYATLLGVSRGLSTDPLIVRYSAAAIPNRRRAGREAGDAALLVAVVTAAVGIAAALLLPGALRPSLFAVLLLLPGLLLLDAARYVEFALARPQGAFVIDITWLIFAVPILWVIVASGGGSAAILAGWGAAAALAGAVGWSRLGLLPVHLRGGSRWVQRHAQLGVRFAAEFVLFYGSSQAIVFAIAVVSGYDQAGAYRGALVLLGPAGLLTMGAITATVPELVRRLDAGFDRLRRAVLGIGSVLAVLVFLCGVAWRIMPAQIGEWLLGASWAGAREVVPWLGLATAGNSAAAAVGSGLRALRAADRSLAATVPSVILVMIGAVSGAAVNGAVGAAVGAVIPMWLGVVFFDAQLRRAISSV